MPTFSLSLWRRLVRNQVCSAGGGRVRRGNRRHAAAVAAVESLEDRVLLSMTSLVKDINGSGGSFPSDLTAAGDTLFFVTDDGTNGYELWKSDGTAAGTTLVKDILNGSGSSNPADLTAVGDTLFFVTDDGTNGYELWKSDGTAAGTTLVKDIYPGNQGSQPFDLTAVGDTLFFAAFNGTSSYELWKSDGTAAGTTLVKDINPGSQGSFPVDLTVVGNTLFFEANDGTNGYELWKSDGTAAGTTLVEDIRPGSQSSLPGHLTAVGDTLFFAANDGTNGYALWKSDGTAAGTMLVEDVRAGSMDSGLADLTAVGDTLFFVANDGTNGYELWTSDGTAAGTTLVKDINPGNQGSVPDELTAVGDTLFFMTSDGTHGDELWKSDGTAAGTTLVKDIRPGSQSSQPFSLTTVGGTLFFRAFNGTNGYELWKSDGTAAGTTLVQDIRPGSEGSVPDELTAVGDTLFFEANDGTNGYELWMHVANTAPTVQITGVPINPLEGAQIALGSSVTDPDTGETHTYAWTVTKDGNNYASGTTAGIAFTPDDDGTYEVSVTATDSADAEGTDTVIIVVGNVAPSVTADGTTMAVDEGATAAMTGVWSDPGDDAVTLVASAGAVVKNGNGTWSWSFDSGDGPDETQTVTITATDSDGATTTTTFDLTVNNVAPTATIGNDGPVDEGSPVTVSLAGGTDPSPADAASLHYFFSTDETARDAATYATAGTTTFQSFTFDDNGSYTVYARVIDDDGGFTDYETVVTVNNVDPTATIGNDGPAGEGSPVTVSLTGGADPSSADAADLHYFFSTDEAARDAATYATAGTTTFQSFTFDDNGSYTVYARVIDDDGGFTDYDTVVNVNNVDPAATIANTGPVDEGSPVTVSLTGGIDPSSADAAGLHYFFSTDEAARDAATYATAGTTTFQSFTFNDDGSYTVYARVLDDDGGFTDYETVVTVNNVAPVVSAGSDASIDEGDTFTGSGSFTDPGSADTWTATVDYGDGSGSQALTLNADKTFDLSHLYADNGTYTVTVVVTDNDAGTHTDTLEVTVTNVAPSVMADQPTVAVDEGATASMTGVWSDPGDDVVTLAASAGAVVKNDNGTWSWSFNTSDGPDETQTVTITATDSDGGETTTTFDLTVNNVDPTATITHNGPVDEGSLVTVSLTGGTDPSSADAASLHYFFSTDEAARDAATYAGSGTTSSDSFTFNDDGSYTVYARVLDDDGGYTDYETVVNVNNVDPTATVGNDGPVNEGSPVTVSLAGGADPSSADAASLHYFFSTDEAARDAADYASSGTTSSDSFTFDDDGSYTVYARVLDDDGGFTDYQTVVTVDNVNPTATIGDTGPVNESVPVTVSLTGGTDPSTADTASLHYFFSTDEAARDAATYATAGTTTSNIFTFDVKGSYTVYARVIDDDGGFTDYQTTITVQAGVGLVTAPRSGYPPIVTVYGTTGQNIRFSFYAYQPSYRGGVKIASGDVNGDGVLDIITAPGGDNVGADIRVYSGVDGTMIHRFFAFAPSFHGGFNVASGDVDGDGLDDIIVSVDSGWKSAVIAFDGQTTQRIGGFFAYGNYRGGVNIATGDINGDGAVEILTIPGGTGVYAHVRAFAIDGQIVSQFVAFPAHFHRGTFNIAAGDVNGDGIDDVIVSVGSIMPPWVRVFNGATPQVLTSILAYPNIYHGGVSIGTGDVNLDGRAEVLTSIATGALPYLGAFDGESGALVAAPPQPYGDFRGGTYIAGNLYNNDTEFLRLDGGVIANSTAASLEASQVEGLLAAAAGKFRAAGFSQTVVEQIAESDIRVADLAGGRLAMTRPRTIVFDVNAAGWGWFIDETPTLDEEFTRDKEGTYLANAGSAAEGKVDLLTVLTHEIAHELGFDDLAPTAHANSLLTATLPPDARRATREHFDDLFADGELMDELLAV